MLSDLLILEYYYGFPACAQFFEDLSHRYDPRQIGRALQSGEVVLRRVTCGPDHGRHLLWLSEKGRKKACQAQGT